MTVKKVKAITIGAVCELTGLTERKIRYYEERKLIFPERTSGGTRKYSFEDIELLVEISKKIINGVSTYKIKQQDRKEKSNNTRTQNKDMIKGQLNVAFNMRQNGFNRY